MKMLPPYRPRIRGWRRGRANAPPRRRCHRRGGVFPTDGVPGLRGAATATPQRPGFTVTVGPGSALGLAGRERLHGVRGERLATNAPAAALDLVDDDPRHRTHVLAFDRHHRVR